MPKQTFDGSRPGPGRPKGSPNKATKRGRAYASAVLEQDSLASDEWDEKHIENPVLRAIRRQVRVGVGDAKLGMLPPSAFNSLQDRIFPKMRELVSVDVTTHEDLSALSDADLAKLAAEHAAKKGNK